MFTKCKIIESNVCLSVTYDYNILRLIVSIKSAAFRLVYYNFSADFNKLISQLQYEWRKTVNDGVAIIYTYI